MFLLIYPLLTFSVFSQNKSVNFGLKKLSTIGSLFQINSLTVGQRLSISKILLEKTFHPLIFSNNIRSNLDISLSKSKFDKNYGVMVSLSTGECSSNSNCYIIGNSYGVSNTGSFNGISSGNINMSIVVQYCTVLNWRPSGSEGFFDIRNPNSVSFYTNKFISSGSDSPGSAPIINIADIGADRNIEINSSEFTYCSGYDVYAIKIDNSTSPIIINGLSSVNGTGYSGYYGSAFYFKDVLSVELSDICLIDNNTGVFQSLPDGTYTTTGFVFVSPIFYEITTNMSPSLTISNSRFSTTSYDASIVYFLSSDTSNTLNVSFSNSYYNQDTNPSTNDTALSVSVSGVLTSGDVQECGTVDIPSPSPSSPPSSSSSSSSLSSSSPSPSPSVLEDGSIRQTKSPVPVGPIVGGSIGALALAGLLGGVGFFTYRYFSREHRKAFDEEKVSRQNQMYI